MMHPVCKTYLFKSLYSPLLTVGPLAADDPARAAACGRAVDALEAVLAKAAAVGKPAS